MALEHVTPSCHRRPLLLRRSTIPNLTRRAALPSAMCPRSISVSCRRLARVLKGVQSLKGLIHMSAHLPQDPPPPLIICKDLFRRCQPRCRTRRTALRRHRPSTRNIPNHRGERAPFHVLPAGRRCFNNTIRLGRQVLDPCHLWHTHQPRMLCRTFRGTPLISDLETRCVSAPAVLLVEVIVLS